MRTSLLLLLLLAASCAPKQANVRAQSMTLSPSANVYLRNSLDADPSVYLGRFVADTASDLDESSSMTLACSKHISYRFVEGGGVRYNELLSVSSAASARLGIPVIASGNASADANRVVRVSYELTGKMVATIEDPTAFAACCKDNPDQCSRRYIGEFLQGRGAIYHQSAANAQGSASGVDPSSGASGDLEFSHGTAWERGVEFPNPVYFAFKTSETPYAQQAASTCAGWMEPLPAPREGGIWVTGTSRDAQSELAARNSAMTNASTQAVRATGITTNADGSMVTPTVRAEDWCIETTPSDKGPRYTAKVLVFVPNLPPPTVAPTPSTPATPVTTTPTPADPDPTPTPRPGMRIPQVDPGIGTPTTPGVRPGAPGTPGRPGMNRAPLATGAMPSMGLVQLRAAIDAAAFSEEKLAAVAAVSDKTFTCAQVAEILPAFSFSADKIAVVQMLQGQLTDPQNYAVIVSQFTFSSDKAAVTAMFQ